MWFVPYSRRGVLGRTTRPRMAVHSGRKIGKMTISMLSYLGICFSVQEDWSKLLFPLKRNNETNMQGVRRRPIMVMRVFLWLGCRLLCPQHLRLFFLKYL